MNEFCNEYYDQQYLCLSVHEQALEPIPDYLIDEYEYVSFIDYEHWCDGCPYMDKCNIHISEFYNSINKENYDVDCVLDV